MIELYDGYVINVDAYNYALCQHTGRIDKRDGREKLNYIGYFSSLPGALKCAANKTARQELSDNDYSLKEALEVIEKHFRRLEEFLKESIPDYKVIRVDSET